MIEYDPNIITQFAEALYKRARQIVILYTLGAAVIVGAVAFAGLSFADMDDSFRYGGGLVGLLLGGLGGYSSAQAKVFLLRLKAQTSLCQVRIEENTRETPGE